MIRYALICEHEHDFEGWFSASADYDDQATRGLVECPFCGSRKVRKQIMSPAVAGTKRSTPPETAARMQAMLSTMAREVRAHVEQNFEYVGDAFAREARDIHEGRSERREIYGEATPADVKKLKDDGVPVAALPAPPPEPSELN